MSKIRALVAAAGRGTRAGLPYPKTLYTVQDKPILVRIAELVQDYASGLTVIASPQGEELIVNELNDQAFEAEVLVQTEPKGMGHAVLCFEDSNAFATTEHVLLIWGDIPFIQKETVQSLVGEHLSSESDFSFATRKVDAAYTVVSRDIEGRVTGVVETRELGIRQPRSGERDIGLFIFRKAPVMAILKEELSGKWGLKTGEHGFLYVIGHLAARGYKVQALPIASELDLVSLNSLSDLDGYI
jgi:bifunctional UDP-N-acetylglucosamine pyrophosphorylase/glucosamine-1-phosphate N-acetyltransferase